MDYSNSAYCVLAMVVEKKSGRSFGEFLKERIFTPLKMDQTIAFEREKNEVVRRAFREHEVRRGLEGDGPEFDIRDDARRRWNSNVAE